ncbi:hypothetical protein G5B47_16915 [Paenibacillus sp. 7124]|uniref:Uncharacterized protein n=1 Tax=Paenibacillus apii TaxID=1850370 RepID=A0A6M1PPT3_9BACL|nr:hypothetical protein [Paenibacillus apii]NGM84102.1 hypothetical protein [Paenibacillus apii]NJJ38718.1 hypothetical protein [Paenibacillus apii]
MLKITKIILSAVIFSTAVPAFSVNAQAKDTDNIYTQYIQEAIEQEIQMDPANLSSVQGISQLNNADFNKVVDRVMEKNKVNSKTKQNIQKLEDAEVVILDINQNGDLVSATSSKKGDVISEFDQKETSTTGSTYEGEPQTLTDSSFSNGLLFDATTLSFIGNQGNTSGKETGAFHRLQTPASTSLNIYNGVVSDSVVLPTYNINGAYNYQETAYLYTGVDSVAEVGFEALVSQSTPVGWYPIFHAKASHTVTTGDDNGYPQPNTDKTYVYRGMKFNNGDTVNGYKVYYYTTDSTLTIREQINYSDIYVVRFNGLGSSGRSVKRVTAIAMNNSPSTTTSFHYGFTTPAIWNNMRFLTNNSSSTAYPSSISGLSNDVWTHGGLIDYSNNTSTHTEKYTFSVN